MFFGGWLTYLKWWFHLNGSIKKHLNLTKDAQNLLHEIIEERRNSEQEKDDLLDMLLQARYEDGSPMPQKQLIDEVMILFTAGHETTSNALSFMLLLLAKHPDIQEKIYQELSNINIHNGDIMQYVLQLQYTKQCIEETMRLYPPGFIMDRISIMDDDYKGKKINEGTLLLLSIYEVHKHPDFWESPEEFNPDRFSPKNKKDYSHQYYPFGAGPRMCVGNNFAMYEMILTIAEIVKKYRVTTPLEKIKINPLITLKPKEVPLNFTER
ncbi:MAG: cytochrome P450 [Flavobacteriaceae bacterium]|nr:cytochrome P450 [Flavobacteriaceae bacterium]